MSNFDPSSINNDLSNLNNKYTKPIDIFQSDISSTSSFNGSKKYKIVYNNGSDINFYNSTLTPTYYTAKNIYLYGLLHNNINGKTISNDSIIGELVIEHTNSSNYNKAFVCFLLEKSSNPLNRIASKFNTSPPKNIDDIINFVINNSPTSQSNSLTGLFLDNIIGNSNKSSYILHKDTSNPNNSIIIFLKPIIVDNIDNINFVSNLSNTTDLFSINAPLYQTIKESFVENFDGSNDNNDIYIDCKPTGASQEEITTYNLPINADLLGTKQQNDFIVTAINFIIFTFIVFVVYFSIPPMYKKIVIDTVNKLNPTEVDNPLVRIRSIDICISLFVFFICYVLFTDGFSNNNGSSLIYGLFTVIIFGVSVSLIQSKKSEKDYMLTIISGCSPKGRTYGVDEDTSQYNQIDDFFNAIMSGIKFYFKSVLKLNVSLFVIFSIVTLSVYYLVLGTTKDITKTLSFIATMLIPVSFVLKIYLSAG